MMMMIYLVAYISCQSLSSHAQYSRAHASTMMTPILSIVRYCIGITYHHAVLECINHSKRSF